MEITRRLPPERDHPEPLEQRLHAWRLILWCRGGGRGRIEAGVEGLRAGVLSNPGFAAPADADAIVAVESASRLLAGAGADVEAVDTFLPDSSAVIRRVWGAALARLAAATPTQLVGLLDPGIREVAAALGGMTAIEFMDAEALRAQVGHELGRLCLRYDLLLCPAVPAGPPLADLPTGDPVRALTTSWAPWTFAFNLSRQPAITVPMGLRADGLPNSVQLAAARFQDDLVLRAARTIERAAPFPVAELA